MQWFALFKGYLKVNSFAQSELSNKQICQLFLICIKRSKFCTVLKNFAQTCVCMAATCRISASTICQFVPIWWVEMETKSFLKLQRKKYSSETSSNNIEKGRSAKCLYIYDSKNPDISCLIKRK